MPLKRKKRFEETRLGLMLKNEAQLEFRLIEKAYGQARAFEPSADLIEAVSYASLNPLFRKCKFRAALIEYRKYGLMRKARTEDFDKYQDEG